MLLGWSTERAFRVGLLLMDFQAAGELTCPLLIFVAAANAVLDDGGFQCGDAVLPAANQAGITPRLIWDLLSVL
jgi:hypothetical protein